MQDNNLMNKTGENELMAVAQPVSEGEEMKERAGER